MGAEEAVDCRQWTQHHLVATDIRAAPVMALTPLQGDADTNGMDVNVCGPDGFTPLMLASFCGGALEPMPTEEDETDDASASIISDLICQGAQLRAQTDHMGETALHLAARYARADAAKHLLDAGADTNAQDHSGRTPLHTAVTADIEGVFQILIRNCSTDLDARMADGSMALILAARLAVEGMVEELIASHADVDAVDELGRLTEEVQQQQHQKSKGPLGKAGLGPQGAREQGKKLTLSCPGPLAESSVTLSPVDSLDSPQPFGGPPASPGGFLLEGSYTAATTTAVSLVQLGGPGWSGLVRQPPGGCLLSLGLLNPVAVPLDWARLPPPSPLGPSFLLPLAPGPQLLNPGTPISPQEQPPPYLAAPGHGKEYPAAEAHGSPPRLASCGSPASTLT
ncbi:PREDICTED: LOW QUALITY PROTEIN: neurogenic locus notch homolog protein 3-like [Galeopterus variegatus]|uniref:LOW QUALITY PROTEIN: neurogenic locus notch homolog protein 3-like n=1 Tax=Galeopterus variegatus TaxID=482537 RepID=A0ABM0S092_GALVR|nr:PREDICTED: LOW QUALITY PROTEIN: neurogenic locus notch homolog protein 3-like [Galeopterus variegatus]